MRVRSIRATTENLNDPIGALTALLFNIDIVICCVPSPAMRPPVAPVDVAVLAGVKRFIP